MFGFLKPSLERRLFALIWPQLKHLRLVIPDGLQVMEHDIPLQATTAIPNLAIAAALISDYYFQREQLQGTAAIILQQNEARMTAVGIEALVFDLQRKKVQTLAGRIEALLFERIAADQTHYRVSNILKLDEDQRAWRQEMLNREMTELYPDTCNSNLDTTIRFVYSTRIDRYQELCGRGFMLGIARRWIAEITGVPEGGFENLGGPLSYFSLIRKSIVAEIERCAG
ncbi:MAG: hypothetical protein KIS67_07205 [Verrucomicrobiae bacterium]|nr:hypothetical protein [Verrucomicrobiae bacterium]